MRTEERKIRIGGKLHNARLLFVEESDRPKLRELFQSWKILFEGLKKFESRGSTIPEGISESAFALEFKVPRVISVEGAGASFDTFDLKQNRRQQIKATSIEDDLTSFGPESVWDDLYFLDFYRDGSLDGKFDVYKIPNNLIYNFKVNKRQTFTQQQKQGRRPRLHMKRGVILAHGIKKLTTAQI